VTAWRKYDVVRNQPGMVGLVQELPESWTVERREEWLAVARLVLNISVKIVESEEGQ